MSLSAASLPFSATGPALPSRGGASLVKVFRFSALGTECQLHYACSEGERGLRFERAAVAWVQRFESRYSRFIPSSLVGHINAAAGRSWVEVDEEMSQMLDLCGELHRVTDGLLDPTALPLMRLWDYRQKLPHVPSQAELDAARHLVGWSKVQQEPGRVRLPEVGMALDFGGFGKEYAVDAVCRLGRECGLGCVLVDFGHDIACFGAPPGRAAWHVGLENPRSPGTLQGSIALPPGRAVASSGDYLRNVVIDGRRYGHIIDPRSGRPVMNGCEQVTVIGTTCLQAGIFSTTCFILGLQQGLRRLENVPGLEALFSTANARGQTRGFWQYQVQ